MKKITLLLITLFLTLYPGYTSAQNVELELLEGTIPPPPKINPPLSPISQAQKKSQPTHTRPATKSHKISLKIENDLIDFGIITPTNPTVRFANIQIDSDTDFKLLMYQDSYLQAQNQSVFIPSTSCDNGTCNENTPQPWTSTLAYGLGIACDAVTKNISCETDTTDPTYFQAPTSSAELGTMAKGTGSNLVKVIYKVNIAPAQQPGSYNNINNFILIPTL